MSNLNDGEKLFGVEDYQFLLLLLFLLFLLFLFFSSLL